VAVVKLFARLRLVGLLPQRRFEVICDGLFLNAVCEQHRSLFGTTFAIIRFNSRTYQSGGVVAVVKPHVRQNIF
jgi:hypothetical protein